MSFPLGFSTQLPPRQTSQGGAREVVSAVDVRLTSLDNFIQSFNFTTTGCSVYLPNGTDLTVTGFQFILSAIPASNTFTLRDNSGNALTSITAKLAVYAALNNNGTVAGTWSCKAFASITELIAGTATVGNAVATADISASAINSTQAMLTYRNTSTNLLNAVVVTATGGTVVFGVVYVPPSANAIAATAYIASCPMGALPATQVMCTYRASGSTFLNAIILIPSGTGAGATITSGTNLVVNAVASTYTSVAALSATQAVCVYNDTTGGRTVTLNVSGSTITNGTVVTIVANAVTYCTVAMLTSTKAIAAYSDATAGNTKAVILDISGTVVTPAAIATAYGGGTSTYCSIAALSATKAIFAYAGASSFLNAIILDVAISTITAATALTVNGATSTYIAVAISNATTAICTYYETTLKAVTLTVTTSTITASTPLSISSTAVAANYNSICALSANKLVDAFAGTSNFLNAEVIEISVSV